MCPKCASNAPLMCLKCALRKRPHFDHIMTTFWPHFYWDFKWPHFDHIFLSPKWDRNEPQMSLKNKKTTFFLSPKWAGNEPQNIPLGNTVKLGYRDLPLEYPTRSGNPKGRANRGKSPLFHQNYSRGWPSARAPWFSFSFVFLYFSFSQWALSSTFKS